MIAKKIRKDALDYRIRMLNPRKRDGSICGEFVIGHYRISIGLRNSTAAERARRHYERNKDKINKKRRVK